MYLMHFILSNQHPMWDQIDGKGIFSLYYKKNILKNSIILVNQDIPNVNIEIYII